MNSKVTLIALSIAILSGCSSIVSKSHYPVSVNSSPDGASFSVTNKSGQKVHSGVTPSTVTLDSSAGYFDRETYTFVVEKDGYQPRTYVLTSTIDGWYWGNILLGGVIGMLIVDPITGAMYNLPERTDISLEPEVAALPGTEGLTIATIDSLSVEQLNRLKKVN